MVDKIDAWFLKAHPQCIARVSLTDPFFMHKK